VRGGDVLAARPKVEAGGGFNLAAAVARQGVPCYYGGPHGTGPYGEVARAALAAEGVELVQPRRPGGDTGFCVTLIEPDGERTFVTAAGVESELTRDDLDRLAVVDGDVVSVSGYDLLYPVSGPVLSTWIDALPAGVALVVDPGPLILEIPLDRLRAALRRAAVFTLNGREARLLAGDEALGGTALIDAVRARLTASESLLIVLREGADGCVAAGGALGANAVAVAAPSVTVVDTTGAGDTHTGVLIAGMVRGDAWPEILEDANRAAALSVTRLGPATAPTREELDAHR
jgi:sugar/nucleoside kinase (ribokinase family)